ncbi:helix-turn-helix transcriptional regulator [Streptomyces sp. NPDC047079]|uniref:helix-turn-helix transcriptional regulator n=1 Tax=Streptomyces sp. NPDC047079 TaxID=3154607 RepID=UPI00340DCA6F
MDADELEEAGRVAEDVFVLQMRRRRAALGLSQAELADRVSKLGGSLYQQTIAKIESGSRAVRLQEADLIAQALGATVSEMLTSSIGDPTSSPEKMDIEELIARVKAAQRRREEMRRRLDTARQAEAAARAEAAAAQELATYAELETRRAITHAEEVEEEVRYLTRISLSRQSELNAKFGPRWREKISYRPPITLDQIKQGQQEYLDNLRELAESANMNSKDHRALLAEIEALSARLEAQPEDPENKE